ncbi:MAG: hypothetical protein ACK5JM_08050 [Rhodoblastus sp.]
MGVERPLGPQETALGPFEALADPAAIAAFKAALDAPGAVLDASGAEIPATFPIVWLSLPALKTALREAAGAGHLPVHESQSFDYAQPLVSGAAYRMSVAAQRENAPPRLVVEAKVADASGAKIVTMRAALRLVPLAEGGA